MELKELAHLKTGFVLISGERGTGKTTACECILQEWGASDFLLFSRSWPHPGSSWAPHWFGTTPTRTQGARRVLVDDPNPGYDPNDVLIPGALVILATSTVEPWMRDAATWNCYILSNPMCGYRYRSRYRIRPGFRADPPPTIWERLLGDPRI